MDNRTMSQATLLRQLREERELSQAEVAAKFGVSRPTYIALEQGKRELTLSEAEKVSVFYDIALESIVVGKRPELVTEGEAHPKKESTLKPRVSIPQERIEKFKQVLLYVLSKTAGKPNVGMTVLYKLLYFIDFDYYEKYGEQLMGLRYFKNHHGPSPRSFVSVVRRMEERGELEEVRSKYFTYDQRKYLPHATPDLTKLTGQEIEMVDDVLARYADKSAVELTRLSHMDPPWVTAKFGKDMRYELVFYRPDVLSVGEYEPL